MDTTATPDAAQALADASSVYLRLQLDDIEPSPTNPRKTFNAEKLAELASSIQASGVHQPVLVRPLPASRLEETNWKGSTLARRETRPGYELVCGERRLRASRLAGCATVPAVVRALTNDQVLEIQITENLQRDDLNAIEEAEGYETLMAACSISADEVAVKIGKSRSYVYARLKLLDLCPEGRQAMHEGKLDASKALIAARIPDHKLQIKAIKEFTQTDWRGDQKLSARGATEWVKMNLMLRLDQAVFDIKDAKLVAEAGSCTSCSKRTGHNPELFSDIDSPDLCTDKACHQVKTDAHVAKLTAAARKKGLQIIEGKEALELKPHRYGFPHSITPVDQPVEIGPDDDRYSVREHLTPDERKQIKAFVDPHSAQVLEVLDEEVFDSVVKRLEAKFHPQEAQQKNARLIELDRYDLQRQYETRWRAAAIAVLKPRVMAGEIHRFEVPVLRAIAKAVMHDDASNETLEALFDRPFSDWEEADNAWSTVPDLDVGCHLLAYLLLRESKPDWEWQGTKRVMVISCPVIESCAAVLGVDLEEIKAPFKQALREQLQPGSATGADSLAAHATSAVGQSQDENRGHSTGGRKRKLTAEQAQSGIAAAMQEQEASGDSAAGDPATREDSLVVAWPYPKGAI